MDQREKQRNKSNAGEQKVIKRTERGVVERRCVLPVHCCSSDLLWLRIHLSTSTSVGGGTGNIECKDYYCYRANLVFIFPLHPRSLVSVSFPQWAVISRFPRSRTRGPGWSLWWWGSAPALAVSMVTGARPGPSPFYPWTPDLPLPRKVPFHATFSNLKQLLS